MRINKHSRGSKSNKSNKRPDVLYVMDMQPIPKKVQAAAENLKDGSMFVKIIPARLGRKTLDEAINLSRTANKTGQMDSLKQLAAIYPALKHGRNHVNI